MAPTDGYKLMVLLTMFLVGGAASPALAEPPKSSRPNIILILADDMRWDAMGLAGDPVIQTPNLDRLAARGVRFRNAFVTSSVCAVSRASVLTGQYARRHGVLDFTTPLPDLSHTYASLLHENGYYTGFIGKWGIDAANPASMLIAARSFDYWAGDRDQTSYWHERTCGYVTNNGTTERESYHCTCPSDAYQAQGVSQRGPHPSLHDPVHLETWIIPEKFRRFLDQRDRASPFCLSISLKAPHGPLGGYAKELGSRFADVNMPRRASVSAGEAERQPDFLRASLASERGWIYAHDDSMNGPRQELMRQYYRLIEGIDILIGQMTRDLEARNLADNTIIVFSSDNGQLHGEHGLAGKWLMYEESIRVPLIVYDPRAGTTRVGSATDALALNIDIAPTILDLAGVEIPPTIQGHTLKPILSNPENSVRDSFFYEHLFELGSAPPKHIEPSEGVRTNDWKYIRYVKRSGSSAEELYHLADDPLETTNLASSPSARSKLSEMRRIYQGFRNEAGPHGRWLGSRQSEGD